MRIKRPDLNDGLETVPGEFSRVDRQLLKRSPVPPGLPDDGGDEALGGTALSASGSLTPLRPDLLSPSQFGNDLSYFGSIPEPTIGGRRH
jgi:hypothetical protein